MKTEGNILILNSNLEERELLRTLCSLIGKVFSASNISQAISILESNNIHVLVVDDRFASYTTLKGLLDKSISLIITGKDEDRIKHLQKEWPLTRYIGYHITPLLVHNDESFNRVLKAAVEHAFLRREVESLRKTTERTEMELKDAYTEIKNIKNIIRESVIKESEKRIELEAKYIWFRREKRKLEEILKNLYIANDVTNLVDTVYDIKELVRAQGISLYILEESETLGKYLKPLVWDDAFLPHPNFTKHVVLLDAQDFAASVARYGHEINSSDLIFDARMSKRYVERLRTPLKSILCVPLLHQKQVIGVIEVYNKTNARKKGFSEEDQQILRTLSEHIAIAITKLNLIQYDALTSLLRPDPFFEKTIQELKFPKKRREEEASYALVMADVDWFKNYNDRNGHEAGNRLLRQLAHVLKISIREEDLICRYGGEEFLFFLTGVKDLEEAAHLTERIRKNVEDHYFDFQEFQPRNNLTMSFGVTIFPGDEPNNAGRTARGDIKRLVSEADLAMAEAKGKQRPGLPQETGEANQVKNRVCLHSGTERPPGRERPEPAPQPSFRERRRHERINLSTQLMYNDDGDYKVAKTVNLSLEGARIVSEAELPVARTMDIMLVLGDKADLLRSDVIYSGKTSRESPLYFSGLRFRDLTFREHRAIEDYLMRFRRRDLPGA